jgi:hypothetical protein
MQFPIPDVTGADFTVYEGDTSPEGYYCYAGTTIDGPWILLGTGNGTTQFDFTGSGLTEAQFIKILDDGDGAAIAPNAGFDLDAIKATDIIPVELVSFTAESLEEEVILHWQTATETNNSGFEIERTSSLTTNIQSWEKIGFVEGQGTTTEQTDYVFNDKINKPGIYSYRLKQIDFDGSLSYSNVIKVDVNTPTEFALYQNYPNPFNPSTTIKFSLPNKTNLNILIYNSLGEKVAEVLNGELEEGYHEVDFESSNLTSGIYFYRLESEQFTDVKKMMIVK